MVWNSFWMITSKSTKGKTFTLLTPESTMWILIRDSGALLTTALPQPNRVRHLWGGRAQCVSQAVQDTQMCMWVWKLCWSGVEETKERLTSSPASFGSAFLFSPLSLFPHLFSHNLQIEARRTNSIRWQVFQGLICSGLIPTEQAP